MPEIHATEEGRRLAEHRGRVLAVLRRLGRPVTSGEIGTYGNGNLKAGEIQTALGSLIVSGKVEAETPEGGSPHYWLAGRKAPIPEKRPPAGGKPPVPLFQRCTVCRGTGDLPPDTRVCLDGPSASRNLVRLPNGYYRCICCGGEKFIEVGLSEGQVNDLVRENRRLKSELAAVKKEVITHDPQ